MLPAFACLLAGTLVAAIGFVVVGAQTWWRLGARSRGWRTAPDEEE